MYEVTFRGFTSKKHAKQFMDAYGGHAEQTMYEWADTRGETFPWCTQGMPKWVDNQLVIEVK